MIPNPQTTRIAAARESLRNGDFEDTLTQTRDLLRELWALPLPFSNSGGSDEVDRLLEELGRKLIENPPIEPGEDDWVLATCVYETGGHTPVIRDLASALPRGLRGMVLTLAGHQASDPSPAAMARTGLDAASIHIAAAPALLETCQRVLSHFQARPPRRLFLFQHPDDSAAIAAAAALSATGTELWLVHHADSLPSAGLYLPAMRIVDLTPRACAFTRHVLGLPSIHLPLTCPDPGELPASSSALQRGHLTTALSGSAGKTRQDSPFSYPETLTALLRATGGTHVHIGPLDETNRAALMQAVTSAGLGPERFIHLPGAPDLAGALRDTGVDLLLNTWPMGGARAVVETMAAGIPVVWHSPSQANDRIACQMAYPGAAIWRRPADLVEIAKNAGRQWLSDQSGAARQHYEERHHPTRWQRFFADPGAGDPLPEGYDASLFLPALWNTLLKATINVSAIAGGVIDHLTPRITDLRSRLKDQRERQKETTREMSDLKQRLRSLEAELRETRFPWPIRLWRRWTRERRKRRNR